MGMVCYAIIVVTGIGRKQTGQAVGMWQEQGDNWTARLDWTVGQGLECLGEGELYSAVSGGR